MKLKVALLLGGCVLAAAAQAAAEGRPTCEQVIRVVNRDVNEHSGRHASSRAVARKLGTDEAWVLQCMQAYGRVPARKSRLSDEDREMFERALEEGRPVEVTEETAEMRWEKSRELRIERRERRQHEKEIEEHRKFYESDDPFFSDFNY